MIDGRVVRGLGRAADFTQVEWVRREFRHAAGIDPHPGTVNIAISGDGALSRWKEWRSLPGELLRSPEPAFCDARCLPARIAGRIPAAIVLPGVEDYPEDKLELVAALAVREHLSLDEGDPVTISLCEPIPARAVLFDIDGTLVDSIGAYLEVARVAAEPLGISVTAEHVRHSLATGANFWRSVLPADGADADSLRQRLSAHAVREWPRILNEHCRVFEGIEQTLDALCSAGIRLGIVSGARPEVLELLRRHGLLDRFDAIVLGADVARRKPDPEGILLGMGKLGMRPEETVYVGDTQVDIQASRAAGVRSVGVLTGAADSATLSACWPDRLISSHARLPAVLTPA